MNTTELKTAAEALSNLFHAFQPSGQVDVDAQAKAYLWAVKDYELPDLLQAVHRFIHGEVSGFNSAFCPSTAQLCQEIRARKEIRELLEKKAARGDAQVIPMRPEGHWLTQFEAKQGQG